MSPASLPLASRRSYLELRCIGLRGRAYTARAGGVKSVPTERDLPRLRPASLRPGRCLDRRQIVYRTVQGASVSSAAAIWLGRRPKCRGSALLSLAIGG